MVRALSHAPRRPRLLFRARRTPAAVTLVVDIERPYAPVMGEASLHPQLSDFQRRLRESEEIAIRLRGELEETRSDTIHDHDTALYSAAYFHTRLQEEILRSERYRHFLSLILVHVDLKDSSSTQQVTHALRQMGMELVSGLTRRTDIVALYRKRQMIVMLPETDVRGAKLLVHRYETMFPSNGRQLSYSVLSYPHDASNIELVLTRLQDMSENLFRQNV
jgi:GGDEF domain-containing protein